MSRPPGFSSHALEGSDDGYESVEEYESAISSSRPRGSSSASASSQGSRGIAPPPGISSTAPPMQRQGSGGQRQAASGAWPQQQAAQPRLPPGITRGAGVPPQGSYPPAPPSFTSSQWGGSTQGGGNTAPGPPSTTGRGTGAPPQAHDGGSGPSGSGRPGTSASDATDDSWRDGSAGNRPPSASSASNNWLDIAASFDRSPLLAAGPVGPAVPAAPKLAASKPPPSMIIGPDGIAKSRMKNKTSKGKTNAPKTKFTEYWDKEELADAFKRGQVFRARFRVNAHDAKEAYITLPGLPHDVLLKGPAAQNRAVEGDVVAVELAAPADWRLVARQQDKANELLHEASTSKLIPDSTLPRSGEDSLSVSPAKSPAFDHSGFQHMLDALTVKFKEHPGPEMPYQTFQPGELPWEESPGPEETVEIIRDILRHRPDLRVTGKVVAVLEDSPRRHNMIGVCLGGVQGSGTMFFMPLDPRLPRAMIRAPQQNALAPAIRNEAQQQNVEQRTLVVAVITEWGYEYQYPCVAVHSSIGRAGEISSETEAILQMEDIRRLDFSQEVEACLPPRDWSISAQELAERRDFRSVRICSIDPPTARDLDDALSVEPLSNGNFRVGVHIADVSHFVPAASALDKEAMQRSTSVYLVDQVIPMLPRRLCEELCSLNPGVDRLAFSITWELTPEGEILDQWAGRSVICSCAKLAYGHAQAMIEGRFKPEGCPVKLHGGVTWDQVQGDVLTLHSIARYLRRGRFEAGALRLDNIKLTFEMDEDGNPVSCSPYMQMEANQLVEEFMLLANMSVARIISTELPNYSVLRCHPAPNQRKLDELQALSQELDFGIDTSSAGALQRSLADTRARLLVSDPDKAAVITLLAIKPMQLALYFSTGMVQDVTAWRHYALAVDHYTHFTSPIRRYPDVLVHRALAAALAVQAGMPRPELYDAATLARIADHGNDRKLAARNVQDASVRLFLCVMLRSYPVISSAMTLVLGGDKFINVYLPEFGCECRLYIDQMGIPLKARWDQDAKELTIDRKTAAEVAQEENEKKHRNQEKKSDINEAVWQRSLSRLRNPKSLPPLRLPLRLSSFTSVPVVVGALISVDSGHPSDIMARLYLQDVLPAVERPQKPVVKQHCCIDWGESMMD